MMKNSDYKEIIEKYIRGRSNTSEEVLLNNWIELSDENRRVFNSLKKNILKKIESENSPEWMLFKHKTGEYRTSKKSPLVLNLMKYASVIVLTAFFVYFVTDRMGIKENEPVSFYAYAPLGEKCNLVLPDKSEVKVNSDSKIEYKHQDNLRVLELKGEAWFDVEEDKTKPFIVKTRDYSIKVTGTSFNVMSYDDFKRTETSLVSGSVEIVSNYNKKRKFKLLPGEKLTCFSESRSFKKEKVKDYDLAWKNDEFHFYKVPFVELSQKLERWYAVKIYLLDDRLKSMEYSGKFRNKETIWQVLDIIKITTPITYQMKDRKVYINIK